MEWCDPPRSPEYVPVFPATSEEEASTVNLHALPSEGAATGALAFATWAAAEVRDASACEDS